MVEFPGYRPGFGGGYGQGYGGSGFGGGKDSQLKRIFYFSL